MKSVDFKRWYIARGMNIPKVAILFGVSQRTISNWGGRGEHRLPKYISMACRWWDVIERQRAKA